jgi:hypothetical protein
MEGSLVQKTKDRGGSCSSEDLGKMEGALNKKTNEIQKEEETQEEEGDDLGLSGGEDTSKVEGA